MWTHHFLLIFCRDFSFRSDNALAFSFMDWSFSFEYSSASSIDEINVCAPHSPTTYV